MDIEKHRSELDGIIENINRIIIGKDPVIRIVVSAWIAKGHVLLEDLPGTGKTMLAKSLAKSVDSGFARIQFTPDLLPSDVTGLSVYDPEKKDFIFREGPVFTNILLADEINRATPRTQSALLECMEERQVTTDGVTRKLSEPFLVIATQNPVETSGTFPLPEAQLDRFMVKLSVGQPDAEEEVRIMERFLKDDPLSDLEAVTTDEAILDLQGISKEVFVHPDIMNYIAGIVQATRSARDVRAGVSPRGTLAMLRIARAYAMSLGRDFVVPEDIKALAVPVFAHRLMLAGSALAGESAEAIIAKIIGEVPVPTEDWSR